MIRKSNRLENVSYDLCGPLYERAKELELSGCNVTKLNIGNPAPFGFNAPAQVTAQIIQNLQYAQGYSDHKGLLSAREAVKRYYSAKGVAGVTTDDIFLGNGVSDLILHAVQGLLNDGDEMLVPSPDYPLWTAAVRFAGGKAVHYTCDEAADWYPDLDDIKRKINSRTRAIVLINPNNPTGAVYDAPFLKRLLQMAEAHGLVVFADEIYDKILYDGTVHTPAATLANEVLCVSFGGLSKNYLAAGFRAGWMLVSGAKHLANAYIAALNTMASLRVCSNVPAQFAIEAALEGEQTILDLTLPDGRLGQQRTIAYHKLTSIPGISCVKPMGAFYMFPKLDVKKFEIFSDQQFALDLLTTQHVLLVPGTSFNYQAQDHFRVVYLPAPNELSHTLDKLSNFLQTYRQKVEEIV